jgi:hypothetical protein
MLPVATCLLQLQAYAFGAPSPTRFANQVFCLRDVVRSKEAFQHAAIDDNWDDAVKYLANKDEVHKIIAGANNVKFWADAEVVLVILQPIMDAIHTIEADKPLLSQMLPLYEALEQHLQRLHDAGSPAVQRLKMPDVISRRIRGGGCAQLWHPSFYASFLLDPMQWDKDAEGDWGPPFLKLTVAQQQQAKEVIVRLTPVADQAAVAAEWDLMALNGFDSELTKEALPKLTAREQQPDGSVTTAAVKWRRKWWARGGAKAYPLIAAAAGRLLTMPVTTCAAERNWSVWGQVYTKLRNRLGLERGEMIVFIRHNLAMLAGELSADEDIVMQLALAAAEEEVV